MAKWRKAKAMGVPLLDTTAKGGVCKFSPDWDFLRVYQASNKTVDDKAVYCVKYYEKLNMVYRTEPDAFLDICKMESVAIACYCQQDDSVFCHLEVLVGCFEKLCEKHGISYEYMGFIK